MLEREAGFSLSICETYKQAPLSPFGGVCAEGISGLWHWHNLGTILAHSGQK